jgi:C-terminal processing protease CtpA/Prc
MMSMRPAAIGICAFGLAISAVVGAGAQGPVASPAYSTLYDALWHTLRQQFFDPGFMGVDTAALQREFRGRLDAVRDDEQFVTLVTSMLRRLPTSHLSLRRPSSAAGVGIAVWSAEIAGRHTVTHVDLGSDAQRAGVRQGDILLQGPMALRGTAGTRVGVDLERCGGETVRLSLRREPAAWPLPQPQVRWRRVMWSSDTEIGLLEILRFGDGAAAEIDRAMHDLANTKGLVIDLRRNEGGNLSFLRLTSHLTGERRFAVALLNRQFLARFAAFPAVLSDAEMRELPSAEGKYTTAAILDTLRVHGGGAAFYTEPLGRPAYNRPTVVLTSPQTASAAEGFVYSILGLSHVKTVGRTTAGAVVGSEAFELGGGWRLLVPTHASWGPDRRLVHDSPIEPTIAVPLTREDLCAGMERDMSVALAALSESIR